MATTNTFSDYLETAVLNHVFGPVPMNKPAALYLALMTTPSTDSTPGQEATAMTNYARQQVTFGEAVSPDGTISNNSLVDFGTVAGQAVTLTNFAIFDAPTGGNMLVYGDLTTPQTASIGNALQVTSGSIVITLG